MNFAGLTAADATVARALCVCGLATKYTDLDNVRTRALQAAQGAARAWLTRFLVEQARVFDHEAYKAAVPRDDALALVFDSGESVTRCIFECVKAYSCAPKHLRLILTTVLWCAPQPDRPARTK